MKIDNRHKKNKKLKVKKNIISQTPQAPNSGSEVKPVSKKVNGTHQTKVNKKFKKKKRIKNTKTLQASGSNYDAKHSSSTAPATLKAPASTPASEDYSALMENIRTALSKTRDHFVLGSSNIMPIIQNKDSAYDDSIKINQGLFSHKKRQSNVDALIDDKLSELGVKRMQQRMQKALEFGMALNTQIGEAAKDIEEENKLSAENEYKLHLHGVKLSQITLGGNCGDMSLFLSHVLYHEFKINSEIYEFESSGLDHGFLVISRDEQTDPNDVRTWNANTIIVDPWLNRIFTPQTFMEHWGKNISLITSPVYRDFHPSRISSAQIRAKCLTEALKAPISLWKVAKHTDSSVFTKGPDTSDDKQSALENLQNSPQL